MKLKLTNRKFFGYMFQQPSPPSAMFRHNFVYTNERKIRTRMERFATIFNIAANLFILDICRSPGYASADVGIPLSSWFFSLLKSDSHPPKKMKSL